MPRPGEMGAGGDIAHSPNSQTTPCPVTVTGPSWSLPSSDPSPANGNGDALYQAQGGLGLNASLDNPVTCNGPCAWLRVDISFGLLPTYSLTIPTTPSLSEVLCADLWDVGANGVEVRDGEVAPMPGDAPPQGSAVLVGWFGSRAEAEQAAAALGGSVAEIPDQDWGEAWKKGLEPISVGRVFVRPSWVVAEVPPGAVEVVLDPGMAFGTGSHATTALCLAALSELLTSAPGASVLDVGTGSGLLAIAARKLGAGRVRGNDNDPVAVRVARENAARNGAVAQLGEEPLSDIPERFDVVIANILANTLVELAEAIAEHLLPGGVALVSGILAPQEDEIRAAYRRAGLTPLRDRDRRNGEWSLLAFRREGPA